MNIEYYPEYNSRLNTSTKTFLDDNFEFEVVMLETYQAMGRGDRESTVANWQEIAAELAEEHPGDPVADYVNVEWGVVYDIISAALQERQND